MAGTMFQPMRWFQFSLRSLFALTACMAVGLTALKFSTHGWAIGVTTITAATLLFAILQAVHGREVARPFWSGFAVCAWGYMAILLFWGSSESSVLGNNLATGEFLDHLFLKFNPEAEENGGGINGGGGAAFNVADPVEPVQPKVPPGVSDPRVLLLDPDNPSKSGGSAITSSNPLLKTPPESDPFGDSAPGPIPRPVGPRPATDPFASPEELAAEKAAQEAAELLQLRRIYFPRIGHCLFTMLIGWIGGLVAQGIASTRRELPPAPPPT